MSEQPDGPSTSHDVDVPLRADTGEGDERRDVLDAMAVYSADGQVDDPSGNDAAAAAALPRDSSAEPEPDREPHGPS